MSVIWKKALRGLPAHPTLQPLSNAHVGHAFSFIDQNLSRQTQLLAVAENARIRIVSVS
jgi:hypothetical protein